MYTCFLFLFFLRVCSKQSYCFAFNATPEGGTRYIVYQSKGFSRLVIGFDVHKNHIESPYSRSVFNFLPGLDSSVGLCAVTCLATLYISILQSIQVKLECGILDF